MRVKSRIEKLERTRKTPDASQPLPVRVLNIIMDAGDAGRGFTPAESHELDLYSGTIERIVKAEGRLEGEQPEFNE